MEGDTQQINLDLAGGMMLTACCLKHKLKSYSLKHYSTCPDFKYHIESWQFNELVEGNRKMTKTCRKPCLSVKHPKQYSDYLKNESEKLPKKWAERLKKFDISKKV